MQVLYEKKVYIQNVRYVISLLTNGGDGGDLQMSKYTHTSVPWKLICNLQRQELIWSRTHHELLHIWFINFPSTSCCHTNYWTHILLRGEEWGTHTIAEPIASSLFGHKEHTSTLWIWASLSAFFLFTTNLSTFWSSFNGWMSNRGGPASIEQAVETWWGATIQAVQACLANGGDDGTVQALAVTGQMQSVILLPQACGVLLHAILSCTININQVEKEDVWKQEIQNHHKTRRLHD